MKRKTIFVVLGGVVVVVAAIVGLVFYATSGITRTADDFFAKARSGDMAAVYAMTSAELRNSADSEKLASFIKTNRFDKVAKTSWSNRSINNNIGTLDGSVTLDDGGVIPLHMQLVSEGGDWKISLIELAEAGVSGGAGGDDSGGLPPATEIANLVSFHTGLFLDNVGQEDVSYFKGFWVDDSVTDADLHKLLAPMPRDKGVLDSLRRARPVVEQVQPFDGGAGFQAAGFIDAAPYRYAYTYQFLRDGKDWKLAGFHYDLGSKPAE